MIQDTRVRLVVVVLSSPCFNGFLKAQKSDVASISEAKNQETKTVN